MSWKWPSFSFWKNVSGIHTLSVSVMVKYFKLPKITNFKIDKWIFLTGGFCYSCHDFKTRRTIVIIVSKPYIVPVLSKCNLDAVLLKYKNYRKNCIDLFFSIYHLYYGYVILEFTYHSYVIDSRDTSDKKVNLDPHRSVCSSTMQRKMIETKITI